MSNEPATDPHAAVQSRVGAFNARHPVGAPVVVTRADGTTFRSRTRSAAFVATPGPVAVVQLRGLCGCWGLERVTPVSSRAEVA